MIVYKKRGGVIHGKIYQTGQQKILKQVARLRGISVSEVREELEIAIEEARNNPDPDAQAEFHRLFGNKTPTPEEFLCIATNNFRP